MSEQHGTPGTYNFHHSTDSFTSSTGLIDEDERLSWLSQRYAQPKSKGYDYSLSFTRLRNASQGNRLSPDLLIDAQEHEQIIDKAELATLLRTKLIEKHGFLDPVIQKYFEKALTRLVSYIATLSQEIGLVVGIEAPFYKVLPRSEQEDKKFTSWAHAYMVNEQSAFATLSINALVAPFLDCVLIERELAEQEGDTSKTPDRFNISLGSLFGEGIANLIETIAHEMYHVRQALVDPEYFNETGRANSFTYDLSDEHFLEENGWRQYEYVTANKLEYFLYIANTGEYNAVKMSRSAVTFYLNELDNPDRVSSFNHISVELPQVREVFFRNALKHKRQQLVDEIAMRREVRTLLSTYYDLLFTPTSDPQRQAERKRVINQLTGIVNKKHSMI
jgi:hypothetical protein